MLTCIIIAFLLVQFAVITVYRHLGEWECIYNKAWFFFFNPLPFSSHLPAPPISLCPPLNSFPCLCYVKANAKHHIISLMSIWHLYINTKYSDFLSSTTETTSLKHVDRIQWSLCYWIVLNSTVTWKQTSCDLQSSTSSGCWGLKCGFPRWPPWWAWDQCALPRWMRQFISTSPRQLIYGVMSSVPRSLTLWLLGLPICF